MAATKSLLAGMAIGAGAALGIREVISRVRRRNESERYRGTDAMLEAEAARTRGYVPIAETGRGDLAMRRESEEQSGADIKLRRVTGSNEYGLGGAESLRRDIGVIKAREDQRRENEREQSASGQGSRAAVNAVQDQSATGRISTNTEAELRRTGTDDNPVRYTRPTEPPTTSGSEAPFIKEGI